MTSLRLLAPTLSLSAFAFLLFGLDAYADGRRVPARRAAFWISLAGLALTLALISPVPAGAPQVFGRGMLVWDGVSYFLSWIAVLTVLLVALLSEQCREFKGLSLSVYFGLILLAAAGLIFVSAANDFLMIFLSIELVGVPSFILTGYLRRQQKSSEAALKFFLIGAFSSAMLAYGVSILYGIMGSTSLVALQSGAALLQKEPALTLLALFFILVSFGFKMGLVPFHMWVPDAFEGAPAPVAAFLSVAPKVAGAAVALRVFNLTLPSADLGIVKALAVLAALTMTIGNLIGLQQRNVIRLLAYSSIAHMGYLLLGLVAGGPVGASSVFLYGWVYLFMNLGAFAVVICLSNAVGSSDLSAFAGLAKRSPRLSVLLALFLVSLAGIPPTAGFVAKFYVFWAAFNAGWTWLVILAAVNSVISVGYYFKILHAAYFMAPTEETPVEMSLSTRGTLAVASFFTLLVGLCPQLYIEKVQRLSSLIPAMQTPAAQPPTP